MLASIETFRWECSGEVNGGATVGEGEPVVLVGERQLRHILEQHVGGPHDHTVPVVPEPAQLSLRSRNPAAGSLRSPAPWKQADGQLTEQIQHHPLQHPTVQPHQRLELPLGDTDQHQRALAPPPFEKPQVAPVSAAPPGQACRSRSADPRTPGPACGPDRPAPPEAARTRRPAPRTPPPPPAKRIAGDRPVTRSPPRPRPRAGLSDASPLRSGAVRHPAPWR